MSRETRNPYSPTPLFGDNPDAHPHHTTYRQKKFYTVRSRA